MKSIKVLLLLLPVLSVPRVYGQVKTDTTRYQLKAVDVSVTRSTVELKEGKKVFNVGTDITSKGGNAADILSNVPSVNIDPQGNVSLRDNTAVRILINGKPSMLTANNGLRQIPASSIEKVEVITNPSAEYEAQGSAGIINIILKKNSLLGFSAALQAGLGHPLNNSLNLNTSYRTGKLNLFSNIGYRRQAYLMEEQMERVNADPAGTLLQTNNYRSGFNVANVYLGLDYYIHPKHTLTASYYHTAINNHDTAHYDYRYYGATGLSLDSSLTRREDYREPQRFNEIEINYARSFNRPGQKWVTNFQYDFWQDDEHQDLRQQASFPEKGPLSTLITRDRESSKDIYLQSDYTMPFANGALLQLGARAGLRAIRSDYEAVQDKMPLPEFTNKLYYDENIYALYTQYSGNLDKLSYLLGVRAEYSNIGIKDRLQTFHKVKNYINLFPTAHLQYHLSKTTDLQLSYSKRINRPRFAQLNPFAGLSDMRFLQYGNPDLNPMYTHALELGVLGKVNNFTINPAVYYQYTDNYFDMVVQQQGDGNFSRTTANLGHENRYGAELSVTYNPFKWWRLSCDLNWYRFERRGEYQHQQYQVESSTWFSTFRSGMKWPGVIAMDLSMNYRAANRTVQAVIKQQYRANFGLSKDLWQDKVSLSFAINNLFDSWIIDQAVLDSNYYLRSRFQRLGRQYTGSIVYRLNRKKSQQDRLPAEK